MKNSTAPVPDTVNVLPNGAWQDKSTGKIVKAAPGSAFNSERARAAALKRAEMMRQRTRQGVLEAVRERSPDKIINSYPDAHQEVVKTFMEEIVLNEDEKARDRVGAYTAIVNMEGSVGKVRPDSVGGEERGMTISFSPEVAHHLVEGLLRWKNRESEEAEVVEGEFKVE